MSPWVRVLLQGDAATLSDTAPVDVDFTAAAAGSATDASRQDHKHDVPEASAADIQAVAGTGADPGVNNSFVRSDHIHPLGPLVTGIDFDQEQAYSLGLEAVASGPDAGAEAIGQFYYNTSDDHPYVFTA